MILLKKHDHFDHILPYVLAALTTLLVGLAAAVLLKIYPFGEKGLMFIDGSQYFSVSGAVQRALLSGENLLYSWGTALGGNFLPTLGYYASSPFNLLLILFPNNLLLGMHAIILLKLLCAALAFCFLLDHSIQGHAGAKGIFSGCYPFMSYAVTFIWNVSWLDGIIALPLIFVGLQQLVEHRRFLLYALSLGLSIFSNFYIGFMLCIASVLFYAAHLILSQNGFASAFKKSFLTFALSSLLAGGLAMVICLPTLAGLPAERVQSVSQILSQQQLPAPFDLMGVMMLTGAWGLLEDNPILFAGIPTLVLALVFFLSNTVHRKHKLVWGGMILFLILSFRSPFLNMLWHGTSVPHCFNYRYSFILSFLLFYLGFEAFVRLDRSRPWVCLGGLPVLGLILLLRGHYIFYATANTRLLDLLLVLATMVCCWGLTGPKLLQKLGGFACRIPGILVLGFGLMLCLNMLENTLLVLRDSDRPEVLGKGYSGYEQVIDRSPSHRNGADYLQARNAYLSDRSAIADEDFFRMERLQKWYLCDSTLFGYKGLSNFLSTNDSGVTQLCMDLGATRYYEFSVDYHRYVPAAADSLLGIRYLISSDPLPIKQHYEETLLESGNRLYRNPTAFSLVLPAQALDNDTIESENPFLETNRFYRSLVSQAEPIYTEMDYVRTHKDSSAEGELDVSLEFTAVNDRPVYLSTPQYYYPAMHMYVNGQETPWPLDIYHTVFCLGSFTPGTQVRLEIHYPAQIDPESVTLYQENIQAISQVFEAVPFVEVQELSNSHLSFSLDTEEPVQHIATTIPFDAGWQVTDNGKPVKTVRNWNGTFLAFDLEGAGAHVVQLRFVPNGLYAGAAVSLVSLAALAVLEILRRRKASALNFL